MTTQTDTRLEAKLGFDRIRSLIADRCSTEYASQRVALEQVVTDPSAIRRRLLLTDEMRLVMMFEENFPANGYIDCLPFLTPLLNDGASIDLLSLGKLRTMLETIRQRTGVLSQTRENESAKLQTAEEDRFIRGLEFAGAHGISGDGMGPQITNGRKAAKNILDDIKEKKEAAKK